ncbi:MAG: transcription antitermination factor NusB [Gemmatimonadota bacterium]
MTLRPETRVRARALQILYAWELNHGASLPEAATGVARLTRAPRELEAAEALAQAILDDLPAIDAQAQAAADNWRLNRIAAIERNILRLGIHELKAKTAPPKVAIDEALWLAHRFAGPRAAPFINGVLDRVAHDLGVL